MTPIVAAAISTVTFGLIAGIAMLPMAKVIPARIEAQWARDIEAHATFAEPQLDSTALAFSLPQKAMVVCLAMLVGLLVVSIYGTTGEALAFSFYYLSVVLLVAINVKHSLLPDIVVLPTMWAGLLYFTWAGAGADHVYGAAAGYAVLYALWFLFKVSTGKDVIGFGDCKTLAMVGAWFGLGAIPIVVGAYVAGFIVWVFAMRLARQRIGASVPTGPAYLIASLAVPLSARFF